MRHKKRVLFIVKNRGSYGGNQYPPFGLIHSAGFVAEMLRKEGICAEVVTVIDGNSIDKEVHDFQATHVIIEALWVTPDKIKELVRLHPKVQWIVQNHSKVPFLAMEGMAIQWLHDYAEIQLVHCNFQVSSNSQSAVTDISSALRIKVKYLPNYYLQSCVKKLHQEDDDVIKIGAFGAIRPLKNHLEQAIGAIKFADRLDKTLIFYINSDRVEQNADPVLKNIRALFNLHHRHELREIPWQPWHVFFQTVRKMDLGLQVSFSESFNIVTADFVVAGVPIVVSPDIEWMPDFYKANPVDSDDISRKLERAYNYQMFQRLAKSSLKSYNKKARNLWLKWVGK